MMNDESGGQTAEPGRRGGGGQMFSSFIIHHSSFIIPLAASFPRGPGFYYHPVKLALLLAFYLCWVKTCWWVDQDARDNKLSRKTWNPLLFAGGVIGLLVLWALPMFWL